MAGKNEHEHKHVHVHLSKEDAADFELAIRRLASSVGRRLTHEELADKFGIIVDDLVDLDVEFEGEEGRRVEYQWSEDGDVEQCIRIDNLPLQFGLCYHCDNPMKSKTETVTKLLTHDGYEYLMHKECADKGCKS